MRTLVCAATTVAVVAVWLGGAPAAPAAPTVPARAAAAADHRAAVVVDTGAQVKTSCVHFTADSITGKQALEQAGVSPVFAAYGGQGTAVCALCGTGCTSANCLTCDAQNYWAYWRAAAGTSSYKYSSAGVGVTVVHDGDVEGWRWGSGGAPPFFSVEHVCGPPPTTTSTAAPSTTHASIATTSVPPASSSPTTAAPASTAASTTATAGATASSSSSTTHSVTSTTATAASASGVAAAASSSTTDRDSARSVVVFAVVLGAIVAWTVRLRLRRRAVRRDG
jgi:hypothetical protein